jgi:hypothetical protein
MDEHHKYTRSTAALSSALLFREGLVGERADVAGVIGVGSLREGLAGKH